MRMYVCMYVCVCVYMYVYMYVCLHICVYVCIYVCMFAYMCVCMYIHVYLVTLAVVSVWKLQSQVLGTFYVSKFSLNVGWLLQHSSLNFGRRP